MAQIKSETSSFTRRIVNSKPLLFSLGGGALPLAAPPASLVGEAEGAKPEEAENTEGAKARTEEHFSDIFLKKKNHIVSR